MWQEKLWASQKSTEFSTPNPLACYKNFELSFKKRDSIISTLGSRLQPTSRTPGITTRLFLPNRPPVRYIYVRKRGVIPKRAGAAVKYLCCRRRLFAASKTSRRLKRQTFEEVSSIMVDLSSTCLAAAICARLRSSFRSPWRSPVRCASSTISAPNCEKALTNSVKLLTPSSRPKERATCQQLRMQQLSYLLLLY